jgi:hypothetical protein
MINERKFWTMRVVLMFWKNILIYTARFGLNMLGSWETLEHLYLELLITLMPPIFV